ncbi:MAG: glycosyltransferase family 4 protein [Acidimicrobiales bacterium]|nr:glycosyltransferase family 4 protein [Acidimicrobiales bacterium]
MSAAAAHPEILLIDYGGHPFTADLAISLKRSGAEVNYVFSSSNESNPHGDFSDAKNEGVVVHDIDLGRPVNSSRLRSRFRDEQQFGWAAAKLVRLAPPSATVVLCQVPPAAAVIIQGGAKTRRQNVVLWLQQLQADLSATSASRALPGKMFSALERRIASSADRVIAISDGFAEFAIAARRGNADGVTVLPNWAPLRYLPSRHRINQWSTKHQLVPERHRVLYSGRMGLEHRPDEIAALALTLTANGDVDMVIVAAGPGVEALRRRPELTSHPNILFCDLQPLGDLANVLASADVLLGTLDDRASEALVPSKILSYLCAARPVVALMKKSNPSAVLVEEIGAGVAVSDIHTAVDTIRSLLADPDRRRRMGNLGRAYASTTFEPNRVAKSFALAAGVDLPGNQA